MLHLILNLFCLIGSVQALSIKKIAPTGDSEETSLDLCNDPKMDALIAPALKEVTKFFNAKGMTVYPFALSAVGSLRYGGNTAVVDGKNHILDHDIDLLIVGPPESEIDLGTDHGEDRWNLSMNLANHLNNSGIQISMPVGLGEVVLGFSMAARYEKKSILDAANNSYDVLAFDFKAPETEMQKRFEGATWKISWENIQEIFSLMEMKSVSEPETDEQKATGSLHIDLYFRRGSQAKLLPHPTKKMLFHGVTMPYPADKQVFDGTLQAAFWHKKSAQAVLAAKEGICAFAVPEDHFDDDMPNTSENKQVASTCSRALKAHGYESFKSLCHQDEEAEAAPPTEAVA